MAGLIASMASGEIAMVAATAKTVLQIKTATNQRAKLKSLRIMGKAAAGGTDTPMKVRLTRSTANFGTPASTLTLGKLDPAMAETIQTAGYANFSVEPTTPADTGIWWEINPQTGVIEFPPEALQLPIPGGNALNIEITSTGTPTVNVTAQIEE